MAAVRRETESEEAALTGELAAIEAEEQRLDARKQAVRAEMAAKELVWWHRRSEAEKAAERERRAYRLAGGEK